ncbi:hypothetical protein [Streptosporangium sp. NPDC051022]|uniref:hypothetical protein n=1 Tax=Streptosporangium sp. NPDC051022 TaxID=3155752 RepID=UPI00343966D2
MLGLARPEGRSKGETMRGLQGMGGVSALDVAESLRAALAHQGIAADINGDHDLAVVSIWAGLAVWCNADRFWWSVGWNPATRRPVYAYQSAVELERAALRVIHRYFDLRRQSGPPGSDSPQVDHGPR